MTESRKFKDPNFETPQNPGPREFGSLPANPPGAEKVLVPDLGQQLGVGVGAGNVDPAALRQFVVKAYQVKTYDLSVERNDLLVTFPRKFSFILVTTSTNATDIMKIRYDSGADAISFLPGSKLNGQPYDRLYLTNAVIAAATMEILFAENWPVDQLETD